MIEKEATIDPGRRDWKNRGEIKTEKRLKNLAAFTLVAKEDEKKWRGEE